MESTEVNQIMERIKQRQIEIEKENSSFLEEPQNSKGEVQKKLVSKAVDVEIGEPNAGNVNEVEISKRNALNETQPMLEDQSMSSKDSKSAHRRARFAALAADLDSFEYDLKPSKSKENYMKGPSPRLSTGEIRAASLFTPTSSYYPPANIRTSSTSLQNVPKSDDNIAFIDDASNDNSAHISKSSPKVPQGSESSSNIAEKRLRFAVPVCENDDIPSDHSSSPTAYYSAKTHVSESNCEVQNDEQLNRCENEQFGIHNFVKKVTDNKNGAELSVGSGARERRNDDVIDELTVAASQAIDLKNCVTPKNSGIAKQLAKKFEPKVQVEKSSVNKFVTAEKINPKTASRFSNFKNKNPVKEAEIDTRSADVKSLRSRWEVSSATGTPLHPDQKQDELLQAALNMCKSNSQARLRPKSYCDSSYTSSRNLTILFFIKHRNDQQDQQNVGEEKYVIIEENVDLCDGKITSYSHDSSIHKEKTDDGDVNKFIDDAFQFVNSSPNKNSSLMSAILNTPEIRSKIDTSKSVIQEADTDTVDSCVPLTHSVSFYRRKERENKLSGETVMLGQFIASPLDKSDSSSSYSLANNSNIKLNFESERARLEKAIGVQQEQIVQASRALSFCHSTQEFKGSREEVDAQRALLIATERRRAQIIVLDRLIQAHSSGGLPRTIADGPRGNLTISDISIKLMRDFVNGHVNYHDDLKSEGYKKNTFWFSDCDLDPLLFYFIVLIRNEETVLHTTMVTSDECIASGKIEFPHYIQFRLLPHDFICTLDIFALRTRREIMRHEAKYHIKGNSLKKSLKNSMFSPGLISPGGPSAVIDPSFQNVGKLTMAINSVSKTKFQLADALYPLDGFIEMKVRCYAEDCGTVGHKGFLSLYQPVDNIASWTRFWCVLWDGLLRFWRYPEDESSKLPVVSIDLRSCASNEVKQVPVESCPYPNSFQIDVWLPGAKPNKPDRIRIMMAADRKDEMYVWLDVINVSLRNLNLWSCR